LPDEQNAILTIVAQQTDAPTFERLDAMARAAQEETELCRDYSARES
jgi:hypothetical protein